MTGLGARQAGRWLWLLSVAAPSAAQAQVPLQLVQVQAQAKVQAQARTAQQPGLDIIASRELGNCVTCHAIGALRQGRNGEGRQGNFGPALDGVGARYSNEQLHQWVFDARKFNPDTLMPPFGTVAGTHRAKSQNPILTPEQIDQVVAALAALR